MSRERFSSQMRIVKTGWRNAISEANLTSLLQIKVFRPSLKVFLEQNCLKAVEPWYNNKNLTESEIQKKI